MLNKLSRKDIELLNILAQTPEGKSALDEYIKQHEKAVKAYKAYRESVVAEVEADKTKRKFKAGDKVRVKDTESAIATAGLGIGDIAEVFKYNSLLGDGTVELKTPGRTRWAYFGESSLELVEEKTPNELRAEIIEKAKDFVEENKNTVVKIESRFHEVNTSFITNASKRTVAALVKGVETRKVRFKGIAKCSPDDVFNEHIGKAIALGRALGKDVSEFENAVQPAEPVVGHKLSNELEESIDEVTAVKGFRMLVNDDNEFWNKDTLARGVTKITNDTNAQYGGVE
ncbi:MAG TPA: hypothetical protein VIR26_09645 [Metalysinibacillus sp.]